MELLALVNGHGNVSCMSPEVKPMPQRGDMQHRSTVNASLSVGLDCVLDKHHQFILGNDEKRPCRAHAGLPVVLRGPCYSKCHELIPQRTAKSILLRDIRLRVCLDNFSNLVTIPNFISRLFHAAVRTRTLQSPFKIYR